MNKEHLPAEQVFDLDRANLLRENFPQNFKFGVGGSAAQIEGGWNADGKGPSVWDTLCIEKPERIDDKSTCFVTCDSYNQWEQDVQLLKTLGCNTYKLSLAWSRILPKGDLSEVNEAGIDYYNRLINALLLNNIEPMVVIWHFDLPSALPYTWKQPELIDHYLNYARLCFERFGDRVKRWITINEPSIYVSMTHDLGRHPPNLHEPVSFYLIIHNLLIAHAQAYRLYETEFRPKQNGLVGISIDCFGFEPATDSVEDVEAAQIAFEFRFGLIASPLLFGKYPDCVREKVDRRSKAEGRESSRLPVITEELSKLMKGTLDYIGLNHYSCEAISAKGVPEGVSHINLSISKTMNQYQDGEAHHFYDPKWKGSAAFWLKVTPVALRSLLNRIKKTYNNPEIMITENGYPDNMDQLEDNGRVNYVQAYLNETLKAIKLDGCNVTGYYYWALLDCWEWASGHSFTFGLVHVDRNDPERKRTPKQSAKALEKIYKNKGFENFE